MSTIEAAIQAAVASAIEAQVPKIVEAVVAQIPAGGGDGGGGPSVAQLAHVFRQVKVETKAESVAALQSGPAAPAAPAASAAPAATGAQDAGGDKPDKPVEIADVMKAWSEYLDMDKTAEGQKILIGSVNPVSAHFGVQRMREISEDQFADSLRYCADLANAYAEGGVAAVQAHRHGRRLRPLTGAP